MTINITELNELQKEKLRGAIKFFAGDRVNIKLQIKDKEEIKPCGALFLDEKILNIFKELVGEHNITLE